MAAPAQIAPPVSAAAPPVAPRANRDATREYVAAGGYSWYAASFHSLPHPIDDVTLDFGSDLYARMLNDAQIASLHNVFKSGMLEDGATLSPAVGDEDPDYEAAAELADWCTWMLASMRVPLDEALWDLCDAIAYGNRVAELVYDHAEGPDGKAYTPVVAVKPKPMHATAFVVDPFNEVVGLLGQIPGKAQYPQVGMLIDPASPPENYLERDRFCVLTFRAQNNDPRGRSLLRPAYDAWWWKQQVKMDYLKYLAQFASPLLIGYTADGGDTDYSGATDISPETQMAQTLTTAKNGTAMAFPFGAKVDTVASQGEGQAFTAALDLQNREMAKAITGQTLGTEEGKHQTRASSGTHQDILDTIIRQAKRIVERMIRNDILRPAILLNFGKKALRLLPKVTLGRSEQHDFGVMATAVAALAAAGYLHPTQYAGIDIMLNLPARDLTEEAEDAADPGADTAPSDGSPQIQPPAQDGQPAKPGQQPEQPAQQKPGQPAKKGQPGAVFGAIPAVLAEEETATRIASVVRRDFLARRKAQRAADAPIVRWDGSNLERYVRSGRAA